MLDFRYEQHITDITPYLARHMFQHTYKEVQSPMMWRNTTERRSSYSLHDFMHKPQNYSPCTLFHAILQQAVYVAAVRPTANDLHLDKTVPLNV